MAGTSTIAGGRVSLPPPAVKLTGNVYDHNPPSVSRVSARSYQNWLTVCRRGASGSRVRDDDDHHGTTVDGLA